MQILRLPNMAGKRKQPSIFYDMHFRGWGGGWCWTLTWACDTRAVNNHRVASSKQQNAINYLRSPSSALDRFHFKNRSGIAIGN